MFVRSVPGLTDVRFQSLEAWYRFEGNAVDSWRTHHGTILGTGIGFETGQVITVTDPGRALITGRFRDIGKLKGPILRGLAAREPLFHNGSATVAQAVNFYNARFNIGLTSQERTDLVNFLKSL